MSSLSRGDQYNNRRRLAAYAGALSRWLIRHPRTLLEGHSAGSISGLEPIIEFGARLPN